MPIYCILPKRCVVKEIFISEWRIGDVHSLVAGLTASGADAYLLHVTTTPSVAYIARVDDFDCGIMISASHNPYYDNGIKLIDCYGEKMPEEILLLVEDYIDGNPVEKNTVAGKAAKAKEKELEEWLRGLDGMDRLVDDYVGDKIPLWIISLTAPAICMRNRETY